MKSMRQRKIDAWHKYYAITRPLERKGRTPEEFLAAFPSRESILAFWDDVKDLTYPETYGQTDWDFCCWVAYRVEKNIATEDEAWPYVSLYIERGEA